VASSDHIDPATSRDVYSVSRLNGEARALLEGRFPAIWVEGEISNLARPRSGHVYFSLKDAHCQVRCAMFRSWNRALAFAPEDGMQVLVRARASLYVDRGEFQLLVEYMEEAGAGALRRAFEALKQKLAAEGLFDPAHKKPIPAIPRCAGVVTSPTGAAIRDVLSVLARRFPALPVVVYPVPVQGAEAAPAIERMLAAAERHGECDVLILARGGGSLEDLWPFNEERVARAVHRCAIPVVTGIGHEIDHTIADLAADRRAATPSAAAELIAPDQAELRGRFAALAARAEVALRRRVRDQRRQLGWVSQRLAASRRRLLDASQRLDGLALRLGRAVRALPGMKRGMHAALAGRLERASPAHALSARRARVELLARRLPHVWRHLAGARRERLRALERTLAAVSPRGTLARGYAIVRTHPERHVLRDAASVKPGDPIHATLARGALLSRVEHTEPDSDRAGPQVDADEH